MNNMVSIKYMVLILLCIAGARFPGVTRAAEPSEADRNLALCVGINGYARMGALRYCVNDAHAVKDRLEASGNFRRVKVLADLDESGKPAPIAGLPTAGNILANLKQFAGLVPQGGTLLFFFSGHGVERGGVNYLIPVDGDETSALSVDDVKDIMAGSKARNKLIILDACRSGLGAKGMAGVRGSLEEEHMAVLVSCGEDQFSYEVEKAERGLFSLILEEGLSGKADLDGDDVITGDELFRYMDLAMGDFCLDNDILTVQTPAINNAGRDAMFLRIDRSRRIAAKSSLRPSEATGASNPLPPLSLPSSYGSQGSPFGTVNAIQPAFVPPANTSGAGYGITNNSSLILPKPPAVAAATGAQGMNATELFNKGNNYYSGTGVVKDYDEAVKWFRLAAEQGSSRAHNRLGDCYYYGRGVTLDYVESLRWYKSAVDKGYVWAMTDIGIQYYKGYGVSQDYAEAVSWFRKAVDKGDARAMDWLGDCFRYGRGVQQDYAEAVKLYKMAVDKGNTSAHVSLGILTLNGQGAAVNQTEAARLFRVAADKGDKDGQHWLGARYYKGEGVPQNYSEAVRYFRLSADQGHAGSHSWLGDCYYNGRGVPLNYSEAYRLYKIGADKGDKDCQHSLGHCYYEGKGIGYDYNQAVHWFRVAAQQGKSCNTSRKVLGY